MKKLFENVGGNKFRLLTESMADPVQGEKLVREAIKKIFSANNREISYEQLQNVGIGYIKDFHDARKCALREAVGMADEYGYKNDQTNAMFVKEDDETNMSSPEESREVQIGKEIINKVDLISTGKLQHNNGLFEIQKLAQELIQMHRAK